MVGYVMMGRLAMDEDVVEGWERDLRHELAVAPSDMWDMVSAAQEVTGVYITY